MKIIKEFKAFALKGNVVDMAVGIIIGAAFGKIVASFVSDVLMPPLGVLLGGVNFADLSTTLKAAVIENGETISEAILLNYGKFIQTVIDFLIIASAAFIGIKAMNSLKKKEEKKSEETKPSKEVELLTDIRDALIRDKK